MRGTGLVDVKGEGGACSPGRGVTQINGLHELRGGKSTGAAECAVKEFSIVLIW